ncbi:phage tail protein [Neptunomonas antarctica]|uniref:Phage Tail Collar Domain n=1 Tax=Neptunomonas antarctica TaxID=619304 RepID=A0A1N7MNV9_9GAMM|nr:phage tail protein [Neptunomonas antarctica]SIS87740.1 hypothetical protein SAMN05421760_106226 [Neptunomonas antarctica]
MDYPKTDVSARLLNDKFTDGDPVGGIPASRDSADYQNMVFDELINLIEGAGLTPSEDDQTLVLQAVQALSATRALGEPFYHSGETPPVGAMEYVGQLLNRADYPELWAYISDVDHGFTLVTDAAWSAGRLGCWSTGNMSTTFRAPKTLGEFVRVWDSGGSVDAGRVLGSTQDSRNKAHTHVYGKVVSQQISGDGQGNTHARNNNGTGTTESEGGTDARPRNIALMLCFWYQ